MDAKEHEQYVKDLEEIVTTRTGQLKAAYDEIDRLRRTIVQAKEILNAVQP